MKTISIKDIANKAGVSISTASYALNGVPKVSKETRNRILQIARDLDYEPNSFAKSLKTRKTRTIGLFVSHMDSPYYFEIIQGTDEALRELEYDFIIAKINAESRTGYTMIRERRIDAAIILGGAYVPAKYMSDIAMSGMPICITDRAREPEFDHVASFQFVEVDNWGGMRLVLGHLWDHGFRRIVFMGGTVESYDAQEREKAFRSFLSEKGLPYGPECFLRGDFREDVAYKTVLAFIESGNALPEAICCANDQMAIGVIGALKSAGIAVPEQIAVTGFDNLRQSAFSAPGLTSIDRDDCGMGRMLARNLVSALEGRGFESRVSIGVSLIARDSCGKTHPGR